MNVPVLAVRLSASAMRFSVVAFFVSAVLALMLWMEPGFDKRFLLAHNWLRDDPAVVAVSRAVSHFGMSAICLILLAYTGARLRYPALPDARAILIVVLFSFAAATLIGDPLKEVIGRPRPATELAGQINAIGRHPSPSFPSGHAAKSLALALPFVLIIPAGYMAVRFVKLAVLLAAGLVCYSRIVLGAHYLSDVLAGAALAFASVRIALAAANTVYARGDMTPEKLNTMVRRLAAVLAGLTLLLPFL